MTASLVTQQEKDILDAAKLQPKPGTEDYFTRWISLAIEMMRAMGREDVVEGMERELNYMLEHCE